MCLVVDEKKTKGFWSTRGRKGKKWCWAYKIYEFHDNKLVSPYFGGVVDFGEIKSNRCTQEAGSDDRDRNNLCVSRGIHVIHNSKRISPWRKDCLDFGQLPVVVRVKCYKEDFVAADDKGEAVFMKVFLTRKEYRRARRLAKKIDIKRNAEYF